MKLFTIALLFLLPTLVSAKPKKGHLRIESDAPVIIHIDGGAVAIIATDFDLDSGQHVIDFSFSDGTTAKRVVTIKPNCTLDLKVSYIPPTPPVPVTCPVCPTPPKPEPCTEIPITTTTIFDECCSCKRDDLKARLDNFAIELNRDPKLRGKITASLPEFAMDYLVNARGIDRSRLESVSAKSSCVEMRIIQ